MSAPHSIAPTPCPPYYAVIFTSLRAAEDESGSSGSDYDATAERMMQLAAEQPGFLGVETARQEIGITVSYWADLDSIKRWKAHAKHQAAQRRGREQWYASYRVRIAKVERDYGA